MKFRLMLATACVLFSLATLDAQGVTKESVAGVTNFARVETTIACAGATSPTAVAGVETDGYTPRSSTCGRRASRGLTSTPKPRRRKRPASISCTSRSTPRRPIPPW